MLPPSHGLTRRSTYGTPLLATPSRNSSLVNLASTPNSTIFFDLGLPSSAKQYSRRTPAAETRKAAPSAVVPVSNQASVPSPFALYTSSQREAFPPQSPLLTSVLLAGNNDLFTLLLPIEKSDIEDGYEGRFLSLPQGVKTLMVRLVMDDEPFRLTDDAPNVRYTVTGHHGASVQGQSPTTKPITLFKTNGEMDEIVECEISLHDGINTIEVAVTATGWGEGEAVYGIHQTFCLVALRN